MDILSNYACFSITCFSFREYTTVDISDVIFIYIKELFLFSPMTIILKAVYQETSKYLL